MRSYMNWWIKCISAVIVKTASRNVAFKATRMRDSIMDGQDKFIMRESDNAEVGAREDCDEDLLDLLRKDDHLSLASALTCDIGDERKQSRLRHCSCEQRRSTPIPSSS